MQSNTVGVWCLAMVTSMSWQGGRGLAWENSCLWEFSRSSYDFIVLGTRAGRGFTPGKSWGGLRFHANLGNWTYANL